MKQKELLLTIKNLKDLGLIGLSKKRKIKKSKKRKGTNKKNIIYHTDNQIKSDSSGMKGFGTQINPHNDIQNENIRLQNEKMKENLNQTTSLLQLKNSSDLIHNDFNKFKSESYNYIRKIDPHITKLIDNDNIDVPATGGDSYFDNMGSSDTDNKNFDNHINYNLTNLSQPDLVYYDSSETAPQTEWEEAKEAKDEAIPKKKTLSTYNKQELLDYYVTVKKGKRDLSNLTKREIYYIVTKKKK